MKKKLLALLLSTLCVMMLFACGENNTTETEHNHESETASTEVVLADPTLEIGYELVDDDAEDLTEIAVEDYMTFTGDYKALSVEVSKRVEVTAEEVETTAAQYFMEDAMYLDNAQFLTEGVVTEGSVVLIDFEGKQDGVAFEGGTAEDYKLGIGSNSFIAGFEEGLVGVNVGDTVDLDLKFPEPYLNNPDLAGKPVVFTVTVKGFAPYSDAMVAAMYPETYTTIEAYKEAVKSSLEFEAENDYYTGLNSALCNELVTVCEFTKLPKAYYEKQRANLLESIKSDAAYYGMDPDSFANYMGGMNANDYAIATAEVYTTQAIAFQAVAKAEGIEITDEKVDEFVKEYVASYGEAYGIESEEAFLQMYTKETLKELLLQEEVIAVLTENATITEK